MKIKGTVTRLLEKDERTNAPARVFFRPENPDDRKLVDGSRCTSGGEIIVETDPAAFTLGQSAEFDVGGE